MDEETENELSTEDNWEGSENAPPWDSEAEFAIKEVLDRTTWSKGEVTTVAPDRGYKMDDEVKKHTSLNSLVDYLSEIYMDTWIAAVPYDEGEPVFFPPAWDERVFGYLETHYSDQLAVAGWEI